MSKFRHLCFCVFAVLAFDAQGAENDSAYLIFKAYVSDNVVQPSYLCLFRKNRCTHIKANDSFSKIKPGIYTLKHIDFSEDESSSRGTKGFEEIINFKLKKNKIYFIGQIKLSGKSVGRYKMAIEQNMHLLIDACDSFPEEVKKYPFANALNGKELPLSCENVPKKKA